MPTFVRARKRVLVPWWALLCLLAFIQSPGKTVADTKHDLTEDPIGFLSASLNMWSDTMPLGQLQNQAYGYLFPQGAFFALFSLLPDVLAPGWLIQALWWSLTLCVAFTGAYRVAEAINVGTHTSRVLAALLYALSPRVITTLGAISSETWPVALAPWILLPLLRVAARREELPWRATARAVLLSGLAVLCTGAVNAVSTAAACIPAGLMLLFFAFTGPRRGRAWAMLGGWLAACAAVSMWWIVPLLLLGKYSPPFTDYIESSGVTTRWLSLGETLRGSTSWTPFVSFERVGGNALVAEPILIYATMAIAAIGLLGLVMRSLPLRRMWLLMLLIGLVIMAAWTEPFGLVWESAREVLDSTLAAVRNLHKFDTIVRLPLVIGFAHATAQLPWPWREPANEHTNETASDSATTGWQQWLHPEKHPRAIASMLVLAVIASATAPAWSARLAPTGGFSEVPGYWHEAADWLNEQGEDTRTLVVPSSPFADQTWGNTRDEPLQPLADVPWAVRDTVPLVPPEAIRGLDGLRNSLTRGREVPALDATLRNNGIGYVLVRHDLRVTSRGDSLRAITSTLQDSPTMEKVAEFADEDGHTAIQIWGAGPKELRNHALSPRVVDTTQVPLVAGGPEVLPRLDEVDSDAPVRILSGKSAGTVTDTPARRGRNYGEVVGAESAILAEDEDSYVRNLVPDYPVVGLPLTQTATGRATIEVSSSASEPYNVGGASADHSVNAMLDGDTSTWWEPLAGKSQAEWVKLSWKEPTDNAVLSLTGARVPVQLRIQTDTASSSVQLVPGETTRIPLPGGKTTSVLITAKIAPVGFAISELGLVIPKRDTGFDAFESSSPDSDEDTEPSTEDIAEDLTPVRVPVVPNSSSLAQRWVFGQEIHEGTLVRLFTVPKPVKVKVDADTCRSRIGAPWASLQRGDGSDHRELTCGEEIELSPGPWRIDAKSDWVSLTSTDYFAPSAEQQKVTPIDLNNPIDASDHDRIVWLPISVNAGHELRVGGAAMKPVTVSGWQQGWTIPAGIGGAVELTYPPQQTWRTGILAGGALATVYALVTVGLAFAWRRFALTSPIPASSLGNDLPRAAIGIAAAATVTLVSSWPGVVIALVMVAATLGAVFWARKRGDVVKPWLNVRNALIVTLAATMSIAGLVLAANPWPKDDYAGADWPLQLLVTAALTIVACCSVLSGGGADDGTDSDIKNTDNTAD